MIYKLKIEDKELSFRYAEKQNGKIRYFDSDEVSAWMKDNGGFWFNENYELTDLTYEEALLIDML